MFDWNSGIVDRIGHAGIGFPIFAENAFPPIPSESIMPLAGFAAARGEMNWLNPVSTAVMAGIVAACL